MQVLLTVQDKTTERSMGGKCVPDLTERNATAYPRIEHGLDVHHGFAQPDDVIEVVTLCLTRAGSVFFPLIPEHPFRGGGDELSNCGGVGNLFQLVLADIACRGGLTAGRGVARGRMAIGFLPAAVVVGPYAVGEKLLRRLIAACRFGLQLAEAWLPGHCVDQVFEPLAARGDFFVCIQSLGAVADKQHCQDRCNELSTLHERLPDIRLANGIVGE